MICYVQYVQSKLLIDGKLFDTSISWVHLAPSCLVISRNCFKFGGCAASIQQGMGMGREGFHRLALRVFK